MATAQHNSPTCPQRLDTTCPQCGKQTSISPEELSSHGGLVVCPQCLASYQVEGVELPAPPAQAAEVRTEADAPVRFCPHCGQPTAEGFSYCPYCGSVLPGQEGTTRSSAAPPASVGAVSRRGKPSSSGKHRPQPDEQQSASALDWKPMLPSYSLARHHLEPASTRFQVFAFVIIMGLLALLAFIIRQAMLL